jgi:hypothetical protein
MAALASRTTHIRMATGNAYVIVRTASTITATAAAAARILSTGANAIGGHTISNML